MSLYNYIKVSLYGQFDGELKTAMRFPAPEAGQPETKLTVFNPIKVLEQFNNARECYAIWKTAAGCYYGLVTRNPLQPGSGAMLLSLMVPHGVILSGRQVISALGSLRKIIIEENNRSDAAVISALQGAGIPEYPVVVEELREREDQMQFPADQQPKGTGYRTYSNGHELDSILSFPYQEEYRYYRRVLIVTATSSLKPGAPLARLSSPIDREFWVECPAGVTAAPTYAPEGERVVLTFTKPGFTPSRQTITAGIPSPYARIEGSVIKVKTPAESGLSFTRKVKLNVTSSKGGSVSGYTISVNGRSINTMEPAIELTEHDMTSGRKVQINIASNNFRPLKMEKDPAELAVAEAIDIVLEPLEKGILLRLDFGDGRLFEQHISIERNTREFSQLHSGNFHGFRAYRITDTGQDEAYNVDVRATSKPVAPAFDNVAINPVTTSETAEAQGRKIPVFENISRTDGSSDSQKEEKKKKEDKEKKPITGPEISTFGSDDEKKPNHKTGIILGVVLSVILLVLAIIFFLPTSTTPNPDDEADRDIITADNIDTHNPDIAPDTKPAAAGTPAAEQPAATAAAPVADEIADLAYLNDNTVWELDKLKTPKYRELVTAIQKGDIEAVANNEYFAVAGRATNKKALDMIDMAWKAIGTPNEGGNRRALQKFDGKGSVDIHDLYEDLARRKPSNPNPNPRPSR